MEEFSRSKYLVEGSLTIRQRAANPPLAPRIFNSLLRGKNYHVNLFSPQEKWLFNDKGKLTFSRVKLDRHHLSDLMM